MTDDTAATDAAYRRFAEAGVLTQMQMLQDPNLAAAIRSRLGDRVLAELQRLTAGVGHGPVLSGRSTNLVVVPGIMGSLLASRGLGGMWWIDAPRELKQLDNLGLTPDGMKDSHLGADLSPVALDITYFALQTAAVKHPDLTHVGYPYDWRKPVTTAADGLATLITTTADANPGEPIHLAAHSMGGLVVRSALMRHPELWDRVGRIAFMGTPHYGSPAIAGYLKNHFWGFNLLHVLGRYLSRETFRSMWGALTLLPAPSGVYPGTRTEDGDSADPSHHPCANFDLYDAAAYELGLDASATARLQNVLNAAAEFHRELWQWHRGLAQDRRDRMSMVAGVGQKTLFRIAYKRRFGVGWEYMDRVTRRVTGDRHRDGDGRVPLASAELEWIGATRYVRAEHAHLPSNEAVCNEVFAWLTGSSLRLPTTPAEAMAATLSDGGDADPALVSTPGTFTVEDPGYLNMEAPSNTELDQLQATLATGGLKEFQHIRLL